MLHSIFEIIGQKKKKKKKKKKKQNQNQGKGVSPLFPCSFPYSDLPYLRSFFLSLTRRYEWNPEVPRGPRQAPPSSFASCSGRWEVPFPFLGTPPTSLSHTPRLGAFQRLSPPSLLLPARLGSALSLQRALTPSYFPAAIYATRLTLVSGGVGSQRTRLLFDYPGDSPRHSRRLRLIDCPSKRPFALS